MVSSSLRMVRALARLGSTFSRVEATLSSYWAVRDARMVFFLEDEVEVSMAEKGCKRRGGVSKVSIFVLGR